MSGPTRPRRRGDLYATTVHGRFVVLDARSRTLTELHADVQDLWPLLDGQHTHSELADRWPSASGAGVRRHRLQIVTAVTQQLAEAGLLTSDDGRGTS